jgi:hypothetical protein
MNVTIAKVRRADRLKTMRLLMFDENMRFSFLKKIELIDYL